MTLLFEIGAVAIALACALHMVWRMRHSKRAGGRASELRERQGQLANRVEAFSRNGPTPDRH